jgi:hypothetical protein
MGINILILLCLVAIVLTMWYHIDIRLKRIYFVKFFDEKSNEIVCVWEIYKMDLNNLLPKSGDVLNLAMDNHTIRRYKILNYMHTKYSPANMTSLFCVVDFIDEIDRKIDQSETPC